MFPVAFSKKRPPSPRGGVSWIPARESPFSYSPRLVAAATSDSAGSLYHLSTPTKIRTSDITATDTRSRPIKSTRSRVTRELINCVEVDEEVQQRFLRVTGIFHRET